MITHKHKCRIRQSAEHSSQQHGLSLESLMPSKIGQKYIGNLIMYLNVEYSAKKICVC